MIGKLKLSASAAVLALLVAGAVSSARAADVVADEGCTLSGAVGIGYMYDWQKSDFDFGQDDSLDGDVDWNTPFGEAGGLVTCGGFNAQADFAYYDHSAEVDGSTFDKDVDGANSHFGGALFWRDPSYAALGVSGSWINQDVLSKDSDTFRVGLFGEFYLDNFTLGASAHYFNGEVINFGPIDIDHDGFELAAYGRFYATPDLSLMIRGDALLANIDVPSGLTDEDVNLNGWAITGEAEYLAWDKGLSIFGGLRYAQRSIDVDNEDFDVDVDDTQVYAGLKFYFGQDGTLQDRQRTGVVDNTSVFQEKLPNVLTSGILGFADAISSGAP